MTQNAALDEFVEIVIKNLEKNGFPERPVSFPLEKMYETASQRGFSFNKVRDVLKERQIASEINGERVIFSQEAPADEMFDIDNMAEAAQKMFERMSDEQKAQLAQMIQNMDPAEMAKIKNQWDQMAPEDKARAMDAAQKNLGR